MRARFSYSLGLGLIALGLVIFFSGCRVPCPRHGVIFRGDWSLEINRIPWMSGREQVEYQQPSLPCDSCSDGSCEAKSSPGVAQVCNDTVCVPGRCKPTIDCLAKPCVAKASPALHHAQMARAPTGGGNMRFLPVPTRPVFSPRTDAPGSIIEVPVPAGNSDSFSRAPSLKLQVPGEETSSITTNPEVVPPPPGSAPMPKPKPPTDNAQ